MVRTMELWRDSGLGKRHRDAMQTVPEGDELLHPKNDAAWTARVESMLGLLNSGEGVTLILLGNRGTGKTQAGAIAIRQACRRHKSAIYTTAMQIYFDLRAGFGADKSEGESCKRFVTPSLLVIDEAHERGNTSWEDRILIYIIDYRYREGRDTILIANQTEEQFAKSMGPSIMERASEGGGVIVFEGKSFRGV